MKKFLLSLLMTICAIAINAQSYVKVTESQTDWSGKYLIVYESSATEGYIYTGVDATKNYVSATINDGVITNTSLAQYLVEIAPIEGSTKYSLMISNDNPGTNAGKYMYQSANSNGLNFNSKAQENTITMDEGAISITCASGPKLQFYKGGANSRFRYYKTTQQGIAIYKYTEGEGGGEEPGDDPVVPETPSLPEGTLYYESFDKCANTGGNDGVWKAISGTPVIQFDNANNTHEKGSGASQCARFGTGKAKGSFTTAALTGLGSVQGGYAIITFKAAAWDGDSNNTIEVSIANGGEFIAETSLTTKKAEWTEYSLGIAGGTANTTITISAVKESNNRFFLDEVKVMASTEDKVTGIEDTMIDENAPVEYYNLQGVKVANPENGIFIKKQGAKATKVVL